MGKNNRAEQATESSRTDQRGVISTIAPRVDQRLIGEAAVYPGHPIVLGYLIARTYPSLDEARRSALGDTRIPGAGGSVSAALEFLRYLQEGVSLNTFKGLSARQWEVDAIDSKTHKAGERQAERLWQTFLQHVLPWLGEQV